MSNENILQLRRHYSNNVRIEISKLERANERDNEVIKLNSSLASVYQARIKERLDRIGTLQEEIEEIELGRRDEEYVDSARQMRSLAQEKKKISSQKKAEVAVENEEKLTKIFDKQRGENNAEKWREKDLSNYYKKFLGICSEIPDYLADNLSKMPNNKGYIWKGIWMMGELPPERNQPVVLFEKMRNGITRIHEINSYESIIYEKRGKERKKLVSRIPRRIIRRQGQKK